MKKWLGVTIFLLMAAPVWANSAEDLTKANKAYSEGDFRTATQLYESLVAEGGASSALYYNLGNAYFRLGEKGKALLHYERGRRMAPRDKDINWNIGVLKSVLADRIPDDKVRLPFAWNEIALLLTLGLLGLLVTSVAAYALPRWTKLWRFKTGFFILWIAVVGILAIAQWAKTKDPRVVVLAKEVFTHYGPSASETKAFLLHEGAEVTVLDESGDWFYITLPNKSSGWLSKSSAEVI